MGSGEGAAREREIADARTPSRRPPTAPHDSACARQDAGTRALRGGEAGTHPEERRAAGPCSAQGTGRRGVACCRLPGCASPCGHRRAGRPRGLPSHRAEQGAAGSPVHCLPALGQVQLSAACPGLHALFSRQLCRIQNATPLLDTHACAHARTCTHSCMHTHAHTHACTLTHAHTCSHVHTRAHTFTHARTDTLTHTCGRTCTHAHRHTLTHGRVRTRTQRCGRQRSRWAWARSIRAEGRRRPQAALGVTQAQARQRADRGFAHAPCAPLRPELPSDAWESGTPLGKPLALVPRSEAVLGAGETRVLAAVGCLLCV